jgi:outer membrane immunogenic protein
VRNELVFAALSTGLVLVPAAAFAQSAGSYDWSGFYAGIVTGNVHDNGAVNFSYPAAGTSPTTSGYYFSGNDLYLNGTLADPSLPLKFAPVGDHASSGVVAGYNAQAGHFVFGVEGDVTAVTQSGTDSVGQSPSGHTIVTATTSLDSLSSIRARAGVAVDRVLLYATGGLALGHTSIDTALDYTGDPGKTLPNMGGATGRASGFVPGVIGGAGIEYAPTDKVSFKFEGLLYRLAGQTAKATGSGLSFDGLPFTPETVQPYSATFAPTGAIIRGGLNFHF